jgi:hypothetical protein
MEVGEGMKIRLDMKTKSREACVVLVQDLGKILQKEGEKTGIKVVDDIKAFETALQLLDITIGRNDGVSIHYCGIGTVYFNSDGIHLRLDEKEKMQWGRLREEGVT